MQHVEFRVAVEELGIGRLPTVEPVVDGVPFRELVASDVHAGLADPGVRWPARHFLGEPVLGAVRFVFARRQYESALRTTAP